MSAVSKMSYQHAKLLEDNGCRQMMWITFPTKSAWLELDLKRYFKKCSESCGGPPMSSSFGSVRARRKVDKAIPNQTAENFSVETCIA